nr:hypothetical protein GCM10025732_39890 [Glycomyces mayteni]
MTAKARTAAVLTGWALLLALAWVLGQVKLAVTEGRHQLGAMPLFGSWEPHLDATLLAPILVGAFLIAFLPAAAARWRWRWAAAATALAAVAFSLALTVAHSHPRTWTDLDHHYAGNVHLVDDAGGPAAFLAHYTRLQLDGVYPIHFQSHPPGLVMFFWGADRIGLSGLVFQNTVIQLGVAAAVLAALAIGRDVAGSASPAAPPRSSSSPRPPTGTTPPTWSSRASPCPPSPAWSSPRTAPAPAPPPSPRPEACSPGPRSCCRSRPRCWRSRC